MKPISVVIPTLNEEHYLPRLLQSFIDQDFKGAYEIIVVDGHSTDKTAEVVKKYQKVLPDLSLYSCRTGTPYQRNFGAKKAQYDNLIFLDADMELPKKSLSSIEKHFQTKNDFIALPMLFPYDWKFSDAVFWVLGLGFISYAKLRKHPVIIGMCIVTTKQVHNRIEGFNEKAVAAEDFDYGLRAYKSGAKYYMLWNTSVRGSARRLDKIGRIPLGIMMQKWYVETIKNGPITDANKFNYEYGKFKK